MMMNEIGTRVERASWSSVEQASSILAGPVLNQVTCFNPFRRKCRVPMAASPYYYDK